MTTECVFRLDDRGDVLLQARLHACREDLDDELTCVKATGHVEWRVRDGHVRVRFRPSLISPDAYARLMGWLVGHPSERVLLSYFVHGRWEYEFLRKRGEAARRIRWLVELYGGGGYCNTRRQKISISSGVNPRGWKAAVDFWREFREQDDPGTHTHALDGFFAGQWILYAIGPDRNFSVSAFGANHSDHVRKWLNAHRGVDIVGSSDHLFAQNCARVFHSVAATFEPRADETDVITHWNGYGRRRSGFRRLALPFRSRGKTWVFSGIEMDPAIELLD